MIKKIKSVVFIFPIALSQSLLCAGLISPENGDTLSYIHVLFEWEQLPETENYEIQIAEDENFDTIISQKQTGNLLYIEDENLEWNHSYHWRIRPIFTSNQEVSWSEIYSFSTDTKLSNTITTIFNETQVQNGVTIFSSFFNYFSAVIDKNGREIWNSGTENIVYYNTSLNGDLLGCYLKTGTENNLPGIEFSFDENILWREPNDEFLHHDLVQLPNGNYMGIIETTSMGTIPIGAWTPQFQGLGFQADGTTMEFTWVGDKLVEWDSETGDVIWSWNTFDHFSMLDYDQYGGTWNQAYTDLQYDWTHVNALVFDPNDNSIYISTRHLSRITKINYPSGEIIWNMGHQLASNDIDMGSELGFSFQHSLQILPNGNILTFDNGNLSPEFRGTDEPISRVIEIAINQSESNFAAELGWSYELPLDLFGFASGNAQKLNNGNVLITTIGGGGRSLEVNEAGDIIWQAEYNLSLPIGAVYRANRIPDLYPVAYSILINNYQEYNGNKGVYLQEGISDISFTLIHKGSYSETFFYFIEDVAGWFDSTAGEVLLHPGQETTLIFSGNISSNININPISINVTPIHHPEKSKSITVTGFTNPLTEIKIATPSHFRLEDPFPNPFNSSTTIGYSTRMDDKAILQIFDITGRLVVTLEKERLRSGYKEILWNAKNQPAGLYIIILTQGNEIETKKIIYLK
tara:strand:- start:1031 stop:3100 length:2070 start_codon:yes stop_codon:yes gene_type:complete